MVDITAVGEIPIDLTQSGVNGQGIPSFWSGWAPRARTAVSGAIPAMPTLEEVLG